MLYVGNVFEVALIATIYHHARFIRMTNEPSGWTSQFREILVDIDASLHDLRGDASTHGTCWPMMTTVPVSCWVNSFATWVLKVLFMRVRGNRQVNALHCFIRIWQPMRTRDGTWTITGMGNELIYIVM